VQFDDPGKAYSVIDNLRVADSNRAHNRSEIDRVFNGDPPMTDAEALEAHADTNTNFLQGARITSDARSKVYAALLGDDTLFSVTLKKAPEEFRSLWGQYITTEINELIRGNTVYIEEQRQVIASLILHGVAPLIWDHPDRWCPYFSSLEDTKFPGRTLVSLRNLAFFTVFRRYTPCELKTKLESAPAGWNKELANKLIEAAAKRVQKTTSSEDYNWKPELFTEDMKANSAYYSSDVVATVDTWELYYLDDKGKVQLLVMPWDFVTPQGAGDPSTKKDFLFQSKSPVADKISEVLCLTTADGNTVPPFRIDTIRSLGFLLYAVIQLDNRCRSKLFDSIFEHLSMYFKKVGGDPDQIPAFRMHNFGMVPDGWQVVPNTERHIINESLVGGGLQQLRQMMGEFSASFTENLNTSSTNPNATATEIIAKVNAASALLTGMLTMLYQNKRQEYKEICRRFCKRNSGDEDVQKFQEEMSELGIPDDMIDVKNWRIRVNKPIGGGNNTLRMVKVDKLMGARGAFDEESQREILRQFAIANTDDPELATQLVKPEAVTESTAIQFATLAIGSLMQGVPVMEPPGISRGQYTTGLIKGAGVIVKRIDDSGGMATHQEVVGLSTILKEVFEQIEKISQDPQRKEAAKFLSEEAGKLMNMIKAYAQRLEESQKSNGGLSGADIAEIEKVRIKEQAKMEILGMSSKAKENRKDEAFQQEANRRMQQAQLDEGIKLRQHQTDLAIQDAEAASKINRGT